MTGLPVPQSAKANLAAALLAFRGLRGFARHLGHPASRTDRTGPGEQDRPALMRAVSGVSARRCRRPGAEMARR